MRRVKVKLREGFKVIWKKKRKRRKASKRREDRTERRAKGRKRCKLREQTLRRTKSGSDEALRVQKSREPLRETKRVRVEGLRRIRKRKGHYRTKSRLMRRKKKAYAARPSGRMVYKKWKRLKRFTKFGEKSGLWCRVTSEAKNTKVVRTWTQSQREKQVVQSSQRRAPTAESMSSKKTIRSGRSRRRRAKYRKTRGFRKPRMRGARYYKRGYAATHAQTRIQKRPSDYRREARKIEAKATKSVVKTAGSRGYKNVRHRGTDYAATELRTRVRQKYTDKVMGRKRQQQGLKEREQVMNRKEREQRHRYEPSMRSAAYKKMKPRQVKIRALNRGIAPAPVHLVREGFGKGSRAIVNKLRQPKVKKCVKVRSRSDGTREAHNGCKGKQKRRV